MKHDHRYCSSAVLSEVVSDVVQIEKILEGKVNNAINTLVLMNWVDQ